MTKEELKNVFKIAKESKLDIYVAVTIPGQEDCEYIVNKYKSLENVMFSRLFRLGAPMTEKFLGHFYSRAKILVWYLASECTEF